MDGQRGGSGVHAGGGGTSVSECLETARAEAPKRGWGAPHAKPTTLILVRHGVTDATKGKLSPEG